jgi:hypothetical protein
MRNSYPALTKIDDVEEPAGDVEEPAGSDPPENRVPPGMIARDL